MKEEASSVSSFALFLSNIDVYRCAGEVPTLAYLVLQEALVGLLDILGQICEENE